MNRYRVFEVAGGTVMRVDDHGPWVRWDDVQSLLAVSANVAARHDVLLSSMREIAGVPVTLPSASAAVCIARETLSRDIAGLT